MGAATITPELRQAEALLRWWQKRDDPRCHLAEIYQFGPGAIRSADTARKAAGVLHAHGHLRRLPPDVEIDGSARREAWELVA